MSGNNVVSLGRPLIGDGQGRYRIHIVGNSGTQTRLSADSPHLGVSSTHALHSNRCWQGTSSSSSCRCKGYEYIDTDGLQSTLARELSAILNLPCILLDTIYWRPGWKQSPADEFRTAVRAALAQDPRGWIVDGNFTAKLGGMVSDSATDIIWLDPPLVLYFPRLCWRTLLRLFGAAPQCSAGCEESVREVFLSRDSILWWCLSNHWFVRKRETERYRIDGVHVGGKSRRLGGWGSELATWKQAVHEMALVEAERRGSQGDGGLEI